MYVQHDVGGSVPSAMMLRPRAFEQGIVFENEALLPTAVDSWFKAKLLTCGDLVHIDRPLMIKHEDDQASLTNTLDQRDLDREYEMIRQLIQPLIDPSLNPPSLASVQGQVGLIRAMHRMARRKPMDALGMMMSVWNLRAWWLAM